MNSFLSILFCAFWYGVIRTIFGNTKQTFALASKPNATPILFWRPQKTGSSTILSLLVSYAFRHDDQYQINRNGGRNGFCHRIAACADIYLQSHKDTSYTDPSLEFEGHMSPWRSALSR